MVLMFSPFCVHLMFVALGIFEEIKFNTKAA